MRAVIATVVAVSSDSEATTAAVGCCLAISNARFGPETTATRSGPTPSSSRITSLIRRPVARSTPFIRETRIARSGMSSCRMRRFSRRAWLGTAR